MAYDLSQYEAMWTKDIDNYWLVAKDDGESDYVVYEPSNTINTLFQTEEERLAVIQKLLDAGVRIVTQEEFGIHLRSKHAVPMEWLQPPSPELDSSQ